MQELDLTPVSQFIEQRNLVPEKYRRYYLHWIRRFLQTPAANNPALSKDDSLRGYVQELNQDVKVEDWQVEQAERAVKLYLYTYLPGTSGAGSAAGKEAEADDLPPVSASTGKALEQMRELLRLRHYSYRTEQTYLDWCRRYFAYAAEHRLPSERTETVQAYLSHLAISKNVAASTQNQAFNALLFLFRGVFEKELGDVSKTVRAKRGQKLPVVLTRDEVRRLFECASGKHLLMLQIIYGGGLRLSELTRLRVKDIDFENQLLYVRSGKGDKDRTTLLAATVVEPLKEHLAEVRELHKSDLAAGGGEVHLPDALARKYPNAPREWSWQYVFPSGTLSRDPRSGKVRRHHISDKTVQHAMRKCIREAEIHKHASVHTLRHSFATHLLMNGINIRQVQEYLGHKSLETTMVYTHVVRELSPKADSPLDALETVP
ncbi:MAG: integron integrase [Lentisphaeria bacterium]